MFAIAKPLTAILLLLGLTLVTGCGAPAESQSLRDRLKERAQQRQAGGSGQQASRAAAVPASAARLMTVTQGGRQRSFYVHAPSNLSSRPGAVLVLHGGGGGAGNALQTSEMNAAAPRNGFLAVYPDAGGERWNDGRMATASSSDDVGFMRAIVAALQAEYGLDPSRVYATGISNGGIMAHKLACDAPDLVRAIAPVSANMPEALRAVCRGAGVPVMMFSGTDDPLMPFDGGRPQLDALLRRVRGSSDDQMVSSPATAAFWASRNGCGSAGSSALPDRSSDGTTITQVSYSGCNTGQVVLFQINGGGHSWPGSATPDRRLAGKTSQDIDATSVMVDFFQRNGL